MKQSTIIAATFAAVNADNNCCTPAAALGASPSAPPTEKKWICETLRPHYEQNFRQCKADVEGFFEVLGDYPESRHNINIKQNQRRLDKWFYYYCGEDKADYSGFERELVERSRVAKARAGKCTKERKERENKEKNECKERKAERKAGQ